MEPFGIERMEQDSLAPVQLDIDVDREIASMNRGKGVQLLAIASIVLATSAGAVFVMQRMDRDRVYEQASATLQDVRNEHVAAFIKCALPFGESSSADTSERLYAAFANMIERSAGAYAEVLRQCEPRLASLPGALAKVRASNELQGALGRLRSAGAQLPKDAGALRSSLQDPAQREDYVTVTAHADKLAKAIFAYDAQDAEVRKKIETLR